MDVFYMEEMSEAIEMDKVIQRSWVLAKITAAEKWVKKQTVRDKNKQTVLIWWHQEHAKCQKLDTKDIEKNGE